jgi:hypothetical protein
MDDERLVKFLTPLERRHPQFVAGVRFVGGVALLIARGTARLRHLVGIVGATAGGTGPLRAAYRVPRAIRATTKSIKAR